MVENKKLFCEIINDLKKVNGLINPNSNDDKVTSFNKSKLSEKSDLIVNKIEIK